MMQWQPVMFTQFCILSQIMNLWINKTLQILAEQKVVLDRTRYFILSSSLDIQPSAYDS